MESISPSYSQRSEFTFKDHFDKFLSEHKTADGYSKKNRTIQKYNTLHVHLNAYATKRRAKLSIDDIDLAFLNSFKQFLIKELNMEDNTVAKYVKCLKTFTRYCISKQLIAPFNYSEVKTIEKEGEIYIINLKQLVQLQNFPIQNKRLEQCRDVFCFQCWTGPRYSDIEALRREDLKRNDHGEKVWELHTIKTSENCATPQSSNH